MTEKKSEWGKHWITKGFDSEFSFNTVIMIVYA